ncbi:unnamed protein product [Linum tenue]|uniref:ABC-type xenobiotic transporter n=1 Tax=Linum tenue TaxID=586396 RepID=A0AAV0GMY7_9ROSI|nr:unnamed protein product [Linum tenue]
MFIFVFLSFLGPKAVTSVALTYATNIYFVQAWLWDISDVENNIVAAERILQYTSIPSENSLVDAVEQIRPGPSWPSRGQVDISSLQVRYAPHLPLVLRGLTCTFEGGKKTGIVGRTGSGKSTLTQTLFRIVEPTAGRITIDGVNISSIALHDLRSRLSIIPQDPTMFEGTVRRNLDPLEEYRDEQIWEALDKCHLGDEVRKKEKKLDSAATSSVDTATDNLIQQTLRQRFFDCTVITIAHRITSVLDSNMVLLLSHGSIEEYDTPARLLENKSSSFAQLVAEYSESQLHASSQILHLVSDAVSVLAGLFLCSAEFWRHRISHNDSDIDDSTLLEEPFLDHDESSLEPKKSTGDDIVTPYSCAGVWGLISFSWIGSLVALGYKKALEVEDVPQLNKDDSVFGAFPSLKERIVESDKGIITTFKLVLGYKKALEVQDVPQLNRDDSVFGASPSLKESTITASKLAEALFFSVWKEILMIICLTILSTATYLVSTIMIISLVPVDKEGRFTHQGYIFFPILFLVANAVDCLSQSQVRFRLQCIGIRTRASLVTMIYNKSLTLSYQSKLAQSSGEIINVVTVDAERISDLIGYLYHLCFGFSLLRWQKTYQERVRESKKERMKATSETLRNMRVLKLQAWEMKFLDKIIGLRKAETGSLRMCAFSSAFISFYYSAASTFVAVVTFAFFDMPIDSGQMLAALNSFSRLQVPIYELPKSISMLYEVKVSFGRIVGYLRLHDLPNDAVKRLQGGSSDIAIEIVEGSFSWDSSSPNPPTLRDVNLKVCRGMKVAVCGAVGSGKSSLLSCILGEVPKMSGLVELCGTKAYVDQSPWIQSGKIKDNILFGQEMDKDKYDRVLEACALKNDLKIFSFGDQTEIGERGVNLSEGQKQRIQIARALYQDADIYLLDDPFSAEDAHTGSHLLKEVLLGHLSSKTVVYVTHQVEFLFAADLILIMKDGRITQSGKYSEICQSSGTDFGEIFGAHKVALSAIDSKHLETAVGSTSKEIGETSNSNQAEHRNGGGITDQGQLVKKEERGVGRVWFSLYWKYLSTASAGAIAVAAELVFQLLQYGNKKLLAWASGVSSEQEEPIYRVLKLFTVYVVLTIAGLACQVARTTVLAVTAYETATRLFNKMHLCIFSAPMAFLDSTPTGRILGRASTDQSDVDQKILGQIHTAASSIIQLLITIAVMSQVAWQVYLVMIPYIAIGFCFQQYYISAARQLSRLVGVCRAPVIQHFADTVSGRITIRSFDQQPRFKETAMRVTDVYSRCKFHNAATTEWLRVRLDLLSSIICAVSSLFIIYSSPKTDPSVTVIALTYATNIYFLQAWLWDISDVENRIVSVERILQYTSIPRENSPEVEAKQPDPSWPSQGQVEISSLQVRYAESLPLVLRGLTCTFDGGKKTGIVGRTGSGKSTLIQTLFRIVDPTVGQIMIDGVDISTIGSRYLRSRLSIIPQDPTMFEGTVRSNLDPLGQYPDEQIWEALDKCQLGDEVRKKEKKLDSAVTENGENWSMGQRQLVCLGRVMLKKSKVLVLDEATASVDTATDNLIQQTLRQHFFDCTVITIAHRITSVLDSDMVLLLSHGLIEEYDTPARLLENKLSSFSQLVAEYSEGSKEQY